MSQMTPILQKLRDEYIIKYIKRIDKLQGDDPKKLIFDFHDFSIISLLAISQYKSGEVQLSEMSLQLIKRLARDGILKLHLLPEYQVDEFCDAIMMNKLPRISLVYQFANQLLRRTEQVCLSFWVYYIMPLFAASNYTCNYENYEIVKDMAYFLQILNNMTYISAEADVSFTSHVTIRHMKKIIRLITKDKQISGDRDKYITTLLSMLRIYMTAALANLINRNDESDHRSYGSRVFAYYYDSYKTKLDTEFKKIRA